MRVIALGSKYYRDWDTVRAELRQLRPGKEGDVVVTGWASGADAIVRGVCEQLNIYCSVSHEPTKEMDIGTGKVLIFHTDRGLGTNSQQIARHAVEMKVPLSVYLNAERFI